MEMPGPDYKPPESPEEVLRRYEAGARYFGDMELADWPDFRGACLSGAIFDGSYMMDGDFRDADLRGASFRRAYIKCSDLRGADVRGATFVDAGLESTDFDGAKYDGTEFLGGHCYGVIGPGDGFPDYGVKTPGDGGGR